MVYIWTFLIVLGVGILLWCLAGILLIPVFGEDMVTVLYAKGNGERLEQKVRGFGWLREGQLQGGYLIVVDCGLTEKGKQTAAALCKQFDWLIVCDRLSVRTLLEQMEQTSSISI